MIQAEQLFAVQVRAEATAAARREVDVQMKSVEKGREDIRALQERLAQAQQDNTKEAHLLAVQAADNEQRAGKLTKQEVTLVALLTHAYCTMLECAGRTALQRQGLPCA